MNPKKASIAILLFDKKKKIEFYEKLQGTKKLRISKRNIRFRV